MDNERVKLPILVVLVLGIVGTIIVAIYCFIGIWTKSYSADSKKDTNAINTTGIGYYSLSYNKDLNSQVEAYAQDILMHMLTSNVEWLYNNLNPQYIEYKNLDVDQFKAFLKSKGLLGKTFNTTTYTTTTNNNNDRVIVINISSNDNTVKDKIIITEYSPNNYSLSFDDFISYNRSSKQLKNGGIDIIISEQIVFVQSIRMKLTIANNSTSNFLLNYNKEYEMIDLEFSDDTITQPVVGTSIGNIIYLSANKTLNYNLEFNIRNIKNINYKALKIKGVKNLDSNSVENITVNF